MSTLVTDKITKAHVYDRYGSFDSSKTAEYLEELKHNLSAQNQFWNDLYILAAIEVAYKDGHKKYYIQACPIKETPEWFKYVKLYDENGNRYDDDFEKAISFFITYIHLFKDDVAIGLNAFKKVFDDVMQS